MALKVVITGWSRGGLGYVFELLRSAGHDVGTTFSAAVTEQEFEACLGSARTIEISSGFVPFMLHPALKDAKFYFILRDPMRVLNSLKFLGYFRHEKKSYPQQLAMRHLKRGWQYRGYPVRFSCYYLLAWYSQYYNHCKTLNKEINFIRVENGNKRILRGLGFSHFSAPYVDSNINASYCKQILTPNALTQPSKRIMKKLLLVSRYYHPLWLPRGGHAHYVNPDWHT